ncbi:AAA family ATPase [Cutibacterium equinum]|uniref:AAA family ATPase n=1 Tax=Cutibacterium equinum TaxID=3016342 RepID=A0ABY7QXS8_9ACTN|nr:AAA family ATPase [Cutibacterium equinum]WCC79515.1 AAA family ATPase [Cutibacterium equinum]
MTHHADADIHERPPLGEQELNWAADRLGALSSAFSERVVGQSALRTSLLVAILARGHVLLESVPGLAKTLAASTLASAVDGSFTRVQCTPDLLPSDIIGTQVFDQSTATFRTELGPVHANIVLLDEINRSSAKTQSAMLEAMQERQTSIGGVIHPLPDPFMVLATQNPIDEEGTYVLPHAQMDRFLLKEVLDYPDVSEELEVLNRIEDGSIDAPADPVVKTHDILTLQDLARRVVVDEAIKRYIIDLVALTRHPESALSDSAARAIEYGASPRASIAFMAVARSLALLNGRAHAIPEDVVALRHAVLRHRVVLSFEAQAQRVRPTDVIDAVFEAVPTP